MKTNYILIDYENVQPQRIALIDGRTFRLFVFVGSNQSRIPFDLASSLQLLGDRAEYIKISGNGSNALDFHIAFYIGQLAEKDPEGCFHIISKDTGFDPLVRHLTAKGIAARRQSDLSEISLPKRSAETNREEKIEFIVKSLVARGHSRPRKVATLSNTINALFMKTLESAELEHLIDELVGLRYIIIDKDKVSYRPPISQS